MTPLKDHPAPDRLYRDTRNGKIAGVCAGIADYYSFEVNWVRLACIIAALAFTPTVVVLYLLGAFLLPKRPDDLYRDDRDEEFWRHYRRSPRDTLAEARHRFRQLDSRLRQIEFHVTSDRFELDRQFSDLESNR
jgi:phage shock protein C